MKAEELDAIRERWREGKEELTEPTNVYLHDDDVPKLLDEVGRLEKYVDNLLTELQTEKAENKRLQKQRAEALQERNGWHKAYKGMKQDLEQVQHERDAMIKGYRGLQTAIEDALSIAEMQKEDFLMEPWDSLKKVIE